MTFRQIDIEGYTPAKLRDQQAPTMVWAELGQMVIDERYQRGITVAGRRAIQRIADDWDWTKYQPVLVAATPDGRLAVVDGQHRAHAAAVVGLTSLPAMVVPMTPSEQAAAFTSINTSRIKLRAEQIYKAKLASGDPVAVEAGRLCEAAGCRLMTYTPTATKRKAGDVFAHGIILKMVEDGEGEVVEAGLRAIRQSEVGSDTQSDNYGFARRVYDVAILKPWFMALAQSQLFLRLPLSEIFDEIEWDDLGEDARRTMRVAGGSVRAHVTDAVVAILRDHHERRRAA